jgi:outer membrane protein assembly factor BamB
MKRKRTILFMSLVILSLLVGENSAYGAGGTLLWEKDIHILPTYPFLDSEQLAVSSIVCIISGVAKKDDSEPYPAANGMAFIKAYDMTSGNLKWERTLLLDNRYQGWVHKIIINGNIAYIYMYNYSENKYTLGAYNASTGQTLWENITDYRIATIVNTYPDLTLVNDRIIGYYNGIIRVYQAKDESSSAINSLLLLD